MTTVSVQLVNLGAPWTKACQKAVTTLNELFRRNGIGVTLAIGRSSSPSIAVKLDPSIQGTAVHGRTSAEAPRPKAIPSAPPSRHSPPRSGGQTRV